MKLTSTMPVGGWGWWGGVVLGDRSPHDGSRDAKMIIRTSIFVPWAPIDEIKHGRPFLATIHRILSIQFSS